MIGMVVVTHGELATEFVAATEHVVGPQKDVRTICIGPEDDMDMRRDEIIAAVAECDSGDGVVIFTDMFGGTPSNLAISIMGQANIEVIAGINLPMLIKFAEVRDSEDLKKASELAADAAHKFIRIVSNLLQKSE